MEKEEFYNYTNYRELLQNLYAARRKKNPNLSYRSFSKTAGIKSPNYLQQIIKGSRNLTQKSIHQIAKGFKFNKEETEYFENLVFMNQAEATEEKEYYYHKILKNRQFIKYNKLRKEQLAYYSEWYHAAVRELIDFYGKNTKKISEKVYPKISIKQVKESINLLENLGLIKEDKKGRWKQTSVHVSTGDEVDSIMVSKFHRIMSGLALAAMEKADPGFCNISAVTIPVKKETFEEVIKILSGFRKELLRMSENIRNPEEVMQVNFQLFPLTDTNS